MEVQYEKVWEHDCLSQLTRIKRLGDIEYYNPEFQVLDTRVDDISDFLGILQGWIKTIH